MRCYFVSDLHGDGHRYRELFKAIAIERPAAVFIGGDLLPAPARRTAAPDHEFLERQFATELDRLRARLGPGFPAIFVIMGNDDERVEEPTLLRAEQQGLLRYLHGRRVPFGGFEIFGYAYVPPTPFQLKDWERYDVSRYVDPGCVPPEEGRRTVPVDAGELHRATIKNDLDTLAGDASLDHAVFLFHTPPYRTRLDRAALDGVRVDGVPLDVHVGSLAVRRFIEARQPWLTLHGHIHESARLTGAWRDRIGRTELLSAAHDGPELALIRFDLDHPEDARRELI